MVLACVGKWNLWTEWTAWTLWTIFKRLRCKIARARVNSLLLAFTPHNRPNAERFTQYIELRLIAKYHALGTLISCKLVYTNVELKTNSVVTRSSMYSGLSLRY